MNILDITPEKKYLISIIKQKEKQYEKLEEKLCVLKEEIAEFEKIYNARIRRLYSRLNELESLLFKYHQIHEYVDDFFSFSEAQKIFDETMQDRRARMEDECKQKKRTTERIDQRKNLLKKDQEELKRLYRELARIFHPDKTHGDEVMMKRINKAYREGNLEELRDLDMEHNTTVDSTLAGLEHKLSTLMRKIYKANKEVVLLRRSDMYVLKRNLLKKDKTKDENILDSLSRELRKEIRKREEEVETYKEKFGLD